ncbi:MAG: hypothetical protein DLM57_01980 [Pseudonocardiales bacterium]|nr:MAG: hypothetical protein DLM57_01980 [Pseudonocardiales bacterium]
MHGAVRAYNAAIRRHDGTGGGPILDRDKFPLATTVERHAEEIWDEISPLVQMRGRLPEFADVSPRRGASAASTCTWRLFYLRFYGRPIIESLLVAPRTYEIVNNLRGVQSAIISIMEPRSDIPPHTGPTTAYVRGHLLLSPQPFDAGRVATLTVAGFTVELRSGSMVVFDDSLVHSAHNPAEIPRVALLLDIIRPLDTIYSVLNQMTLYLTGRLHPDCRRMRRSIGASVTTAFDLRERHSESGPVHEIR